MTQIRNRLAELIGQPEARHFAWRLATVHELPFTAPGFRFAAHFPEFPYRTERYDTSRGLFEMVRGWFGLRAHGGDCDDQASLIVAAIDAIRPDLRPRLEFVPEDQPQHVRAQFNIGSDAQAVDHTPYFPLAAR